MTEPSTDQFTSLLDTVKHLITVVELMDRRLSILEEFVKSVGRLPTQ